MFPSEMTLPEYVMTAGESKNITIPIYNHAGKRIDVTDMSAKFAIADFVNVAAEPILTKDCSVIKQDGDAFAVLFVDLEPGDTIGYYGKYIYQVTGKDSANDFGVMAGILTLLPNRDKSAILM